MPLSLLNLLCFFVDVRVGKTVGGDENVSEEFDGESQAESRGADHSRLDHFPHERTQHNHSELKGKRMAVHVSARGGELTLTRT